MEYQMRDGTAAQDPRLGRLKQFDERSREFPVVRLLRADQKRPRSYTWGIAVWLDQDEGVEGHDVGGCTGYSGASELAARPVVVSGVTNALGLKIYRRAKEIDEWTGEQYSGSSVLAATKAIMELGHFSSYHWAFGLDDLILAVGYKGPAVLGINWYAGMFQPDSNGVIKPTGSLAGGHAIVCNGVSLRKEQFRLHNTWGRSWGVNGGCYISFADMEKLLDEQGEAMIPTRQKVRAA